MRGAADSCWAGIGSNAESFPHDRPGNIEESVCSGRRYGFRFLSPTVDSGLGQDTATTEHSYMSYSDPHLSLSTDQKHEVTREKVSR